MLNTSPMCGACAAYLTYRVLCAVQMQYAELLWLDRLGMYIRCELLGREPQIVRVPFMRPVIDDRDARSVITMAAQLAWEKDRSYTPPLPSIFQNTN